MLETEVVHIATQGLMMAAKISAPLLIVSLVIGVVISLLQAIFQVQDQTLSMVPRLAAGGVVLAMTGGWMLRVSVDFTQELFRSIPAFLNTVLGA